jgi:hypothetical protein
VKKQRKEERKILVSDFLFLTVLKEATPGAVAEAEAEAKVEAEAMAEAEAKIEAEAGAAVL